MTINVDRIPTVILDNHRWVGWRWESRNGKPTKPLYVADNPSRHAKSNDASTWRSSRVAIDAVLNGKFDGAGYVLGDGDAGVDIDDCRDPQTGVIAEWAQSIIAAIDSYTEVSPSDTGVKIFVRIDPSKTLQGGKHTRPDGSAIELFSGGKYFTVTGRHVSGTPTMIEDRTTAYVELHTRLFAATNGRVAYSADLTTARPTQVTSAASDDDQSLIDRARKAANAGKFSALWTGDISGYGSHSEADAALCSLLAFWTAGDASRVDRLFRQSGLMRDKWEARRGDTTYGAQTIARAIERCHERYTPSRSRSDHHPPDAPAVADNSAPAAPHSFNLTDCGNAEYFAARRGADVRFDHRRGRWLLWRGHRWQPDAAAEIRRLAKSSMRQRFTDAAQVDDPDARSRAAKWAIASESRARLDALLYLAQSEPPIADAGDDWDADHWLLGVPNGVIDLRTGLLRAGRRDDRLTMQTGAHYDAAAGCARWEQFIGEIFDGDASLIDFVHRAIGYSLTGDTSEQALFLLYGTGANGKGTLINTLKRALGDYAWNMPFATIEMRDRSSIPNDLAALVNRRFVVASETNDGARLNESRVKALTGCDPVTARFLHGEFFTFEPLAKFWLSVNHKPVVRDDSHGFWRRIRLIPFVRTFAVNAALGDALREEAPGILAWAVRGALAWQQDGLKAPAIVTAATAEYERDSDTLAGFLEEACDVATGAETGASELFEHYKRWAERHGLSDRERLTATKFGAKVSERFRRAHTRAGKVYSGLSRRPL